MSAFLAIVVRELRRSWTSGGLVLPVAFFLLVAAQRLQERKGVLAFITSLFLKDVKLRSGDQQAPALD